MIVDILVSLSGVIFILVFGIVISYIDVLYCKKLKQKELKEREGVNRMLRVYNLYWARRKK